ncbi:hypothetical protein [Flavobacterium sp. SORGH_AS_0622]|uniref:hypothetical protein n=1 Tax=Flavobacterium sp. SORGH_AS_0622 TaxID=3041772 RepID=UPI0027869FAD|nr:hypothetical protein [Flavobacterium sp. SORGH_AS_0622]MDQ1165701.1 hypothetical protein [Flavobacterium sp. SORGH_AS_0622]
MIKVYLDWNVMAQMKNNQYNELREVFLENDKFFLPYSTSHIGDLLSGLKENETLNDYINSDLEFIGKLTKNNCLINTGADIVLDLYQPHELFKERAEDKKLFKDLSIDGLEKLFAEDDANKGISSIFSELIKAMPLDSSFNETLKNPESAEQLKKIYPGLTNNPTMEGFFKSFSDVNIGLNEGENYKELRQIVQSGVGINRDSIFNTENPAKLIEGKYSKLNIDKNKYVNNSKNAPDWFNEISNEYLLLDIHGYQEDNVNVKKGRKETFKNTTEDAFHAAFASTCNFYVVNDNKSYNKTKRIYEKLGINTFVFKPAEFLNFYNKYLNINDIGFNLSYPLRLLIDGEYYEEKTENDKWKTYYFPYFLFDFFNKMTVVTSNNKSEDPIIVLGQINSKHYKIYSMEIKRLVNKISELLGKDIENIGEINFDEFQEEKWIGRKWKLKSISFRLQRLNGHFQFYIDL